MAEAVFLILLLLSSGVSAPASFALQRYQFGNDFSQLNLPATLPSNPNGVDYFFSYVGIGSANSGSPSPISAEMETQNLLPQIPISGGGANYLYARQGNVYYVYPETMLVNGGNPLTPIAFGPLLSIWLDSERRRSRFRIYVEILDLLRKGPMTPYEVSFHLRLNSKRTREYIEFLADKKFLDCSDQEGRITFAITPPGAIFVENLRMILNENE